MPVSCIFLRFRSHSYEEFHRQRKVETGGSLVQPPADAGIPSPALLRVNVHLVGKASNRGSQVTGPLVLSSRVRPSEPQTHNSPVVSGSSAALSSWGH